MRLAFTMASMIAIAACTRPEDAEPIASDTLAGDTALVAEPTAENNIYSSLRKDARFAQFVAAIDSAGLMQTLSGPGPFTVFAPVNEAFSSEGDPYSGADIRGIVLAHITNGDLRASDLANAEEVTTLEGNELSIVGAGDSLRIDGARIVDPDGDASNGVIHSIDKLLRPESDEDGV
ncbi:MAG: fasciclin domain-containing protein [Rhodothermales bacterium]